MYSEHPPFERGQYLDAASGSLDNLLGREYVVEDINYTPTTPGAKPHRTGRLVTIRLVKNSAAGNLLPKRLARFLKSGVKYGQEVDGYTALTAERGYPVDEYLPTAGVPTGSYFYIVVSGPSMVILPLAGSDFNGDVTEGDRLVALTAVTSGSTTGGRVARQNFTGATTTPDYSFLTEQISNYVGRALSAKTTGATSGTDTNLLIDVGKW